MSVRLPHQAGSPERGGGTSGLGHAFQHVLLKLDPARKAGAGKNPVIPAGQFWIVILFERIQKALEAVCLACAKAHQIKAVTDRNDLQQLADSLTPKDMLLFGYKTSNTGRGVKIAHSVFPEEYSFKSLVLIALARKPNFLWPL